MTRRILAFSLLCLCSAVAFAQGGLRYTIQVIEFENRAGWSAQWRLGDAWGAVLTDKLQESGNFIVIAEKDMREAAMDEQDFASSGRTTGGSKAPVTGQMTPAQLIVKGVITSFDDGTGGKSGGLSYKGIGVSGGGSKATISGTAYVVDTTTATVVASHNFEAEVKSKKIKLSVSKAGFHGDVGGFKKTPAGKVMDQACGDVVTWLGTQLESVPWSATVVTGSKSRIIINRGTREGVSVGQVFRVGKAEDIRDPDTGELLDRDFTETGRISVTEVKDKIAYCKLDSGEPPRKGDQVYQ